MHHTQGNDDENNRDIDRQSVRLSWIEIYLQVLLVAEPHTEDFLVSPFTLPEAFTGTLNGL